MQRARSYRIIIVFLAVGLAGFVALAACSNYAEGDRCESLNGNEDCVNGLQCTPKAQLSPPFNSSDRCCPPDRTTATTPACTVPQNSIAGDSAPPAETGPGVDATVGDTSPPQEAGTDAADAADANEGG